MAATAVFVVATLASHQQQRKAAKQERKAAKIQGKRAAAENARSRRKAVVESRRARAQAIASGESSGLAGGSQVAGVTGSISSQVAESVSFQNQQAGREQARFGALQDAADFKGKAATFQAIANVAGAFRKGPTSNNAPVADATPEIATTFQGGGATTRQLSFNSRVA